ncbi:MAD2 mitotic arrest deficient-like 1 [Chamberlinius hualienensis]
MTETQTKNIITLKGSVEIVTEFLEYAINSILYQRGLYPSEDFTSREKYGLRLLVTGNEKVAQYLREVLTQVKEWLLKKMIKRVVLLITNPVTKENLERWDFIPKCEATDSESGEVGEKEIKDINNEIRAVIRQITASVTFLPLLEGPCAFDVMLYIDKDVEVSSDWNEGASCNIENSQEVRFRSFSTAVHSVDTVVSYRC